MSDPRRTRLASEVRARERRIEPLSTASPATGVPFEEPRRRTTRFRLERVSLLPFVPAPLIAYVERARVRRARLFVVAAVLTGAALIVAIWFFLEGARPSATTETQRNESAPPGEAAPDGDAPALDTAPPDGDSVTPAPLPPESAERDDRESAPAPSLSRDKRNPNDDVDRSARPRPKGASSAWWW